MKLDEYVDRAVQAAKNAGVRLNRKSVLEDLSTSAGVNFQTLAAADGIAHCAGPGPRYAAANLEAR